MSAHDDDRSGTSTMPLKRRRSFLAVRNAEADGSPRIAPFPTVDEDDGIPILTEVVSAEEEGEAKAPTMAANLEELVARMVRIIEQQMACELPTLIEATLLDVATDLRAGIASTVKTALRDFVAEQKQDHSGQDHSDER